MKLPKIRHLPQKLLFTAAYLLIVVMLRFFGITCIYLALFHLPCPGCGITRALLAALRLDFSTAFSYHPMFLAVPVMYLSFLMDGRLFSNKWMDAAMWCLIGIGFAAVWLTRLM